LSVLDDFGVGTDGPGREGLTGMPLQHASAARPLPPRDFTDAVDIWLKSDAFELRCLV